MSQGRVMSSNSRSMFSLFRIPFFFFVFKPKCLFLKKIVSIFNLTKSLRIPTQIVEFCKGTPGLANRI